MTYCSPSLYGNHLDFVRGFPNTATELLEDMLDSLEGDWNFDIPIRWGHGGIPKRLYFVRVTNGQTDSDMLEERWWVCFLVDSNLPLLWR